MTSVPIVRRVSSYADRHGDIGGRHLQLGRKFEVRIFRDGDGFGRLAGPSESALGSTVGALRKITVLDQRTEHASWTKSQHHGIVER